MKQNSLATETSPYLLQHQHNPVDWLPWGEKALARARTENRPILLSVGYSACHWCHVMAHESFEDLQIASLMNAHFVNIKVDREERPDLDQLYQSALALLGEQGGWPLTMFLLPDGRPFWGGTYFPPTARFGRPGFADVLNSIRNAFQEKQEQITNTAGRLREALESAFRSSQPSSGPGSDPEHESLALSRSITRRMDPFFGGVGDAPKFPHCPVLMFLWTKWLTHREEPFRQATLIALRNMSQGGIYDHLGGGFARYSVDERWLVPHFEKMLYDNAQLIELLGFVWRSERDPLFLARVSETIEWLQREMRHEQGGFFSALDADSEGEEGTYYVWTAQEIADCLGPEASSLFCRTYGVSAQGNWEGKTILNRLGPDPSDEDDEESLTKARAQLLARRQTRVAPGCDDKIMADWNGLLISALVRAARIFRRPDWLQLAEQGFRFISENLADTERPGRLLHLWRNGKAGVQPGLLDDYAFMARAGLDLAASRAGTETGRRAKELSLSWLGIMQDQCADGKGGFYLSLSDQDDLFFRPKANFDNATPSSQSILLECYARLYIETADSHWEQAFQQILADIRPRARNQPIGHAQALWASGWLMQGRRLIIGGRDQRQIDDMEETAFACSLPYLDVETCQAGKPQNERLRLLPDSDLPVVALLCRAGTCSAPITNIEDLRKNL